MEQIEIDNIFLYCIINNQNIVINAKTNVTNANIVTKTKKDIEYLYTNLRMTLCELG